MVVVGTVRDRLKSALATADAAMNCYDVWPDTVNTPAALVRPAEPFIDRMTLADGYNLFFDIHVLVSLAGGLKGAQDALDAYCSTEGSKSLWTAIEGSSGPQTLSGAISDLMIQQVRGYGATEVAGVTYLGVVFSVRVLI